MNRRNSLYQDDIANEIRAEYIEQLRRGKAGAAITQELITQYHDILNDDEDAAAFWLALADTQWEYGRLEVQVKENALRFIRNPRGLLRWEDSPAMRQTIASDLERKLNAPQPEEKAVRPYRRYQCAWRLGDVFAYPLSGDRAKSGGLSGRYFLLYKIDETVWHPDHIVPVVWVKITNGVQLPQNKEEFDALKYMPISRIPYEDRPWIADVTALPSEQARERKRVEDLVDTNGYLNGYRLILLNTSKRVIPKELVYVGNFQAAVPPAQEYVPFGERANFYLAWKFFDKTMIEMYEAYKAVQS